MMDTNRETYESLVEQKKELEDLWQTEKDKSKVAQRVHFLFCSHTMYLYFPHSLLYHTPEKIGARMSHGR